MRSVGGPQQRETRQEKFRVKMPSICAAHPWKSMVQAMGRGARAQDRDAPAPYGTSNSSSEQAQQPQEAPWQRA